MNSKEKALELMDKYWELDVDDKAPVFTEKCKKCALIAVDEVLEHCYEVMKPFWQEVKQEIKLL